MKTSPVIAAFLLTFAGVSTAHAADLVNKDARAYKVDLICDGATTHGSIAANAVQQDSIEKGCKVFLKDGKTRSISVTRGGNVVITKGKLSEV